MRYTLLSAPLLALCLLPNLAMARDASTIRIETNPVYGASVTVEEGVRVFRPLPSVRYVIVNPEGKTPLNLTIEERNVTVRHHYYGATIEYDGEGAGRYAGAYLPGFVGGWRHRHRVHHRHRHGHRVRVPRSGRPGGVR